MKILSAENWQEKDPTCDNYLYLDHKTGDAGPLFPEYWLKIMFKPRLSEDVPEDIIALFEVARATMLYGYFYYPLFNLGMEQFHRVAEAALTAKYSMNGGPPKTKTNRSPNLFTKIRWLRENGFISESESDEWHWVREARNHGSHLSKASTYPPVPATIALEETADRINRLFA